LQLDSRLRRDDALKLPMPEAPLTPGKRTIEIDPDGIGAPLRAPFVELGLVSCFSFLRGASEPLDLVLTARSLGYDAIGIADANSMAGVVRIHTEAKTLKLRPVIGTRIETVEGLAFLAYPKNRTAYGCLCRLLSAGRMQTLDGGRLPPTQPLHRRSLPHRQGPHQRL